MTFIREVRMIQILNNHFQYSFFILSSIKTRLELKLDYRYSEIEYMQFKNRIDGIMNAASTVFLNPSKNLPRKCNIRWIVIHLFI